MSYRSTRKIVKKRAPKGYHFVRGGVLVKNRKKKKKNAFRKTKKIT